MHIWLIGAVAVLFLAPQSAEARKVRLNASSKPATTTPQPRLSASAAAPLRPFAAKPDANPKSGGAFIYIPAGRSSAPPADEQAQKPSDAPSGSISAPATLTASAVPPGVAPRVMGKPEADSSSSPPGFRILR